MTHARCPRLLLLEAAAADGRQGRRRVGGSAMRSVHAGLAWHPVAHAFLWMAPDEVSGVAAEVFFRVAALQVVRAFVGDDQAVISTVAGGRAD
ncbi:hypothetical protein CONLIGDRAFT_677936 [Coniochaeta ligniaria NRRL 30616]|uniref:Uncharacterized protein n=1 Tax=Coniochaeta ligniaria NRRL 30616 TaxID=1408157 RepID=A0A1J7IUX1_9PEZI|nr:hypothetical protein CONLIGDRAFT_677936 [Coniochaeta ligniaria NRRL 30616]